ncbi:apolipoprotein N-acyltransferase [Rubrivirga sp. IMCC43871]|uniref:apolipoprotein N-acyltransferase n=1 Tax=Rubrivirga sp. IMCC43871 TaxID=3391575 RepID=UPI0039903296
MSQVLTAAPQRQRHAPLAPGAPEPTASRRVWRPAPWLVGAALYALSWPVLDGVALSFLAWGAFVPLLVELERHDRFAPFALRVVAFMGLAGLVSCWWWFASVPAEFRVLAWAGGAHEILLTAVPLLLLFPLRKALSYDRALAALVPLWPLWEWAYNHWELSISSLVLGYSQAGTVWLVQYADLFGVWALTAWVVGFNVVLTLAYRKLGWSRPFRIRGLKLAAVLLAVPLAYAGLRAAAVAPSDVLRVSAVYTDFEPIPNADGGLRISRATHLTDSVAYYATEAPELYVWPESAIPFAWTDESQPFLQQAVADWQTPLLSGHSGLAAQSDGDSVRFNRAVLLAPDADGASPIYDKRRLMPFKEGLPHERVLGAVPALASYRDRERLIAAGQRATTFSIVRPDGEVVRVATPICHEQQFPGLWAGWARDGTDLFVHLSFESWFGERAFWPHFLNITRVRAIESRRSVVRVSNGGPTAVIDGFGTVVEQGRGSEGAITESVALYRGQTLYAKAPWLFPLLCVLALGGVLAGARLRRL